MQPDSKGSIDFLSFGGFVGVGVAINGTVIVTARSWTCKSLSYFDRSGDTVFARPSLGSGHDLELGCWSVGMPAQR